MGLELRRRRYGDAVRFIASDISAGRPRGGHHQRRLARPRGPRGHPRGRPRRRLPGAPAGGPAGGQPALHPVGGPRRGCPVAASFEPRDALDGGPDGLDLMRRLLPQLPTALGPDGVGLPGDRQRPAGRARRRPWPRRSPAGPVASTPTWADGRAWPRWRVSSAPCQRSSGMGQVPDDATRRPPPVLSSRDADWLDAALAALLSGGIVGLPTETVYGVAVLPRPEAAGGARRGQAAARGQGHPAARRRPRPGRPASWRGDVAHRLAGRFWPGPLTLVLPLSRPDRAAADCSPAAAPRWRCASPIMPCRAPSPRELGPLAVTSANRSGEPEARTRGRAHRGARGRRWRSSSTTARSAAACPRASSRSTTRAAAGLLREGALSRERCGPRWVTARGRSARLDAAGVRPGHGGLVPASRTGDRVRDDA